jgi:hypothetical protein
MRRRELLMLLGAAMTAAHALSAQQKAMPVIGFLGNGLPDPWAPLVDAFRQGLSEAGYVEGQNVAVEYRWSERRYDRLPALAAELVARRVDVIVTAITCRQLRDLLAQAEEAADDQRIGMPLAEAREAGINLGFATGFQHIKLQPLRSRSFLLV